MNQIFDELKRWEKRERWGEKNIVVSNELEIRDVFNGKTCQWIWWNIFEYKIDKYVF